MTVFYSYGVIKSPHDEQALQTDLTTVVNWANTWQMKFNIYKCVALHCSKLLQLPPSYLLNNQLLQNVTEHLFLGVMLDNKMSFPQKNLSVPSSPPHHAYYQLQLLHI